MPLRRHYPRGTGWRPRRLLARNCARHLGSLRPPAPAGPGRSRRPTTGTPAAASLTRLESRLPHDALRTGGRSRNALRAAWWLRRHALGLATGLAAALPVIVSTVHAVSAGWLPLGDDAIIAVRALDVFSTHPPLLGQYSVASSVIGEP